MGRGMSARIALAAEDHELALLEAARARTLNHDLGLVASEAGNLVVLAEAAFALGHDARAAAAVRAGLAIAPEGSPTAAALAALEPGLVTSPDALHFLHGDWPNPVRTLRSFVKRDAVQSVAC